MWSVGGGSGCVCVGVAVKGQDGNSDVIFVPINVLHDMLYLCLLMYYYMTVICVRHCLFYSALP